MQLKHKRQNEKQKSILKFLILVKTQKYRIKYWLQTYFSVTIILHAINIKYLKILDVFSFVFFPHSSHHNIEYQFLTFQMVWLKIAIKEYESANLRTQFPLKFEYPPPQGGAREKERERISSCFRIDSAQVILLAFSSWFGT